MLKLNVTSSKNENGDDAAVSVDTVSLEGAGDGRAVARTGRGQFMPVRQTRGTAFPSSSSTRRPGVRLTGCWGRRLRGVAHFCSAHCSSRPLLHSEGPGLNFQHTSKGLTGRISLELYLNLFLLPIPVCFKRQKLMGMEMILSNWTIFLASKCAGQPAIQCSGKWNFVVWESQATTLPLRVAALPCRS